MVIHFTIDDHHHLLFIENKLGSQEGFLQLSRYSDHLRTYQDSGYKTHLLYITKYHDPKDSKAFIAADNNASFKQLRWYEVYNWLKLNRNAFIDKVLEYMEEIQLNETRRFVPQDIYAIQNMQRLVSMMDSCLGGAVEETLRTNFGPLERQYQRERFVQLRDNWRYMTRRYIPNESVVSIGFYITEGEYPLVSIMYEVSRKSERFDEIVGAMKVFISKHPDWTNETDSDDDPPHICYDISLLQFLLEEDHISSIQKWFLDKLIELTDIKVTNPQLGWGIN
ncbi:PD-(D/E)XK nuclease family protein [Paenibacillus validus]